MLTMLKNPTIATFYHPGMSMDMNQLEGVSKSPAKPRLLMEYLGRKGLMKYFAVYPGFELLKREDFYIAHTKEMVDGFFDEGKTSRLLGMKWSPRYGESVVYENSSLYHAIRHAVLHPGEVSFSPSSSFHHANPTRGALFCAFSGQVIASMKIYHEFGLCGAYIDLDGHYGNSIDNSRGFVKDIDKAISPVCGNINIMSSHQDYLEELEKNLAILEKEITEDRIHYLVFAHGADSHEWDDLASQLTTGEWTRCSEMVYSFVRDVQEKTGKQIPLTLTLFGGYRRDDFNSVLSLHALDLVICLNELCGNDINYNHEVHPWVDRIKSGIENHSL